MTPKLITQATRFIWLIREARPIFLANKLSQKATVVMGERDSWLQIGLAFRARTKKKKAEIKLYQSLFVFSLAGLLKHFTFFFKKDAIPTFGFFFKKDAIQTSSQVVDFHNHYKVCLRTKSGSCPH